MTRSPVKQNLRFSRKTLPLGWRQQIGSRLKSAREHANLSQAIAAERFGFPSGSTLAEYEQGRSETPLAVLLKAEEIYGSAGEVRRLLFGEETRHRCEFLELAQMVVGYRSMRRVVLALTQDKAERRRAKAILAEALRLKKLEVET